MNTKNFHVVVFVLVALVGFVAPAFSQQSPPPSEQAKKVLKRWSTRPLRKSTVKER